MLSFFPPSDPDRQIRWASRLLVMSGMSDRSSPCSSIFDSQLGFHLQPLDGPDGQGNKIHMVHDSLPAWLPLSVMTWAIQMIAYHGFGLWFEYLDNGGGLSAYKVRRADRLTYRQILPRVIFNQVFVLLPAMVLVEWLGLAFVGTSHIGLIAFVLGLVGLTIGHDLVQYGTHRFFLHQPSLMRGLGHSVHHTTTASRAISACYMSPADYFLEITCPYLLPLMAINALGWGAADLLFHMFTVTAGAFGGLYEHSGFDFSVKLAQSRNGLVRMIAPLVSSKAHSEHHGRGNVSFSDGFGSTGILDTLFKTRWDLARRRQPQTKQEGQGL